MNTESQPNNSEVTTSSIKSDISKDDTKTQKLGWGKSLSLKTKTTLLAIAISLIPLSTVSLLSYIFLNKSLITEISVEELEKTQVAADNVTRFLEDRVREIEALAEYSAFTDSKLWDATTLKEKTAVLDKFKDNLEFYNSIVFFDVKGDPIFQAKSDTPNKKNYGDKKYFQEALKTGKITINGPGISASSGQLRVEFAAPVRDLDTGEIIGILRFKIPGSYLNNLFDIYRQQHEHWSLINSEGIVFAGDIEEFLENSIADYVPGILPLHQDKENGTVRSQMSELANEESHDEESHHDDGKQIISYVPAKGPKQFPDLHIGVMLAKPESVAFAPVSNLVRVLILGTVATAILVTAIAVYLANRATIPLIEAVSAVKKIGAGELDARLAVTREDELGELNSNINLMAEQIQKSLQEQQILAKEQRQEKEQLEVAIYTLLDEVSDATNGDLTVRANLDNLELSTVADLFNAIIDNLQDIAIEAKESTTQVGDSLKQNESAIRFLAEQAITEAQETRNTLVSVEQMSRSIREVAENAKKAEQIVDDTYSTVLIGTENMDLTVNSILELRNTVGETTRKMKHLGESSSKISQVTSLIEEIALKTNVLAINASSEAHRAGEYGQGFAIVAEQVGSLAKQCSAATKEIAKMVAAIQAETNDVNQAMISGTSQVAKTTHLVQSTKKSLTSLLEKSQEINQLMGSISQNTVSQADTSQNVTSLMQKIAELSETTSASSQEVAQSIVETAQIAAKLQSTVAQFKVAEE